ncbi:MAG: DUF1611 domain-containing protein [Myxococcota bacterium]
MVEDPTERLERATRAFTTKRVPSGSLVQLVEGEAPPRPGDLVLARVDAVRNHVRVHLPEGGRKNLFEGDELILVYGDRYAPRQFEARVPTHLGPCHLVAAGGVAAEVISSHARIHKGPTTLTPIGLVANSAGFRVNLADWALPAGRDFECHRPATIAVCGTSMDSGKTTLAAHLTRGLVRAGQRVGYAKVTGTGAGGDPWLLRDAGASPVVDLVDAGVASTYRLDVEHLEWILGCLWSHLRDSEVDAVILEVADGLLQTETASLLRTPLFSKLSDGILFACADSMGALAGVEWLRARGLAVLGIGGTIGRSPLQLREAVDATGALAFRRRDLADPATALKIFHSFHR